MIILCERWKRIIYLKLDFVFTFYKNQDSDMLNIILTFRITNLLLSIVYSMKL